MKPRHIQFAIDDETYQRLMSLAHMQGLSVIGLVKKLVQDRFQYEREKNAETVFALYRRGCKPNYIAARLRRPYAQVREEIAFMEAAQADWQKPLTGEVQFT